MCFKHLAPMLLSAIGKKKTTKQTKTKPETVKEIWWGAARLFKRVFFLIDSDHKSSPSTFHYNWNRTRFLKLLIHLDFQEPQEKGTLKLAKLMLKGTSSSILSLPLKLYTSYLQVQHSNLNVNTWPVLLNTDVLKFSFEKGKSDAWLIK